MMVQEAAQEIIQDQTALDQAPQHIPIGFEPGEVVIEARGDGFCSWISKALVGKEAAGQRAGGKGYDQGLLDAAQTRREADAEGPPPIQSRHLLLPRCTNAFLLGTKDNRPDTTPDTTIDSP